VQNQSAAAKKGQMSMMRQHSKRETVITEQNDRFIFRRPCVRIFALLNRWTNKLAGLLSLALT
jgi:hypothetical protein